MTTARRLSVGASATPAKHGPARRLMRDQAGRNGDRVDLDDPAYQCLRPAKSVTRSGQPFGCGAVYIGWPRPASGPTGLRRSVECAQGGNHVVQRSAQLGLRLPRRRQCDQSHGSRARVAAAVVQHPDNVSQRVHRRIVHNEVPDQLGRQETICRRMGRQEMQCGSAVTFLAWRKAPPHHDLFARLVARTGGTRQRRTLAATQRDRAVVGPEPDQSFTKGLLSGQRVCQLLRRVLPERRPAARPARRRTVLPILAQRGQSGGRRRRIWQPRPGAERRVRQ